MEKSKNRSKKKQHSKLPYSRINYILMIAGIISNIIGFYLLYIGDINFAPVLIVLGYCVFFPLGLLIQGKRANSSVGRERLVYTQEVGGSNPLSPNDLN